MDRAELKARARAQLGGGSFQNLWMMGLAVCLLIGLLESAAAGIIPKSFGHILKKHDSL